MYSEKVTVFGCKNQTKGINNARRYFPFHRGRRRNRPITDTSGFAERKLVYQHPNVPFDDNN